MHPNLCKTIMQKNWVFKVLFVRPEGFFSELLLLSNRMELFYGLLINFLKN